MNIEPLFTFLRAQCKNRIQKIGAHALLSTRINNTELEGGSGLLMLDLFASFLTDINPCLSETYKQCSSWLKRLENPHQKEQVLKDVSADIAQKALQLNPGAFLLIPGGWSENGPGHAMLYTLTKNQTPHSGNTYTFRVINTGAGLQCHLKVQTATKTKHLLACSYCNIPEEKLLYGESNREFFQKLLSYISAPQKADFDPEIIYKGVLARLTPYKTDTDLIDQPHLYITAQRSGTCSFAAPKAYLRLAYHLSGFEPDHYKQSIYTLKETILSAFFRYIEPASPTPTDLCLLEEMHRELAHTVAKRNQETKNSCLPLLSAVNTFIQKHKKPVQKTGSDLPKYKTCDYSTISKRGPCYADIFTGISRLKPLHPLPKYLDRINGDNALEHANKLNFLLLQYQLPLQRLFSLHHVDIFAQGIVLDSKQWVNPASFEAISELLLKYNTIAVQHSKSVTPRHLTTILTLYYTLWAMLPTCDQIKKNEVFNDLGSIVGRLAPPQTLFTEIDENLFVIFFNTKEHERYQEIKRAFEDTWPRSDQALSICETSYKPISKKLTEHSSYEIPGCSTFDLAPTQKEQNLYLSLEQSISEVFKKKDSQLQITRTSNPNVNLDYLIQAELANTKSVLLQSFCSSLGEIRKVSYTVLALTQGLHNTYQFYTVENGTYQLKVSKRSTFKCYYQTTYGLSGESDFPCILKAACTQKSLKTKQWESTGSYEEALKTEAAPFLIDFQGIAKEDSDFLKELASLTTQNLLAPYHLLILYSQHTARLEKAEERILFLTQLFKTSPLGKNQIQQSIFEDPNTITDGIHTFITNLEKLAFNAGENRDQHELFLFSSYILSTLSQYYPGEIPEKLKQIRGRQLNLITQKLSAFREDHNRKNETHARLYHLHAAYALTAVTEPTELELIEAYSHYFAFHTFPSAENQSLLFVEKALTARIHDLLPTLMKLFSDENNFESLTNLVQSIIRHCHIYTVIGNMNAFKDLSIDRKTAEIKFSTPSATSGVNVMSFNCASAIITHAGQPFKRSGDFDKRNKGYKFLFEDQSYPVYSLGDQTFLLHPGGSFRRIGDQITFHPKNMGDWVIFIPAPNLSGQLPLPFLAGYTHFWNPKTETWTFVKGRRYDLFDQSLTLKKTAPITCPRTLQTYHPIDCSALKQIERKECTFKRVEKNHQTFLELPRYNLALKVFEDKLVFQQDPRYYLVENTLPTDTLCVQKRCLVFTNDDGKQLLLVPLFRITAKNSFNPEAPIKLPEDETSKEFDWSSPLPKTQYSLFKYERTGFEDNPILTPYDNESSLALAYYLLYDRRFREVLFLLNSISPIDTLSLTSFSTLEWIIQYGPNELHSSPEVYACILRASLIYFRAQLKSKPDFIFSKKMSKLLDIKAKQYLESKTHIDKMLILTRDEEQTLDSLLPTHPFKHHLSQSLHSCNALSVLPEIESAFNEPFQLTDKHYCWFWKPRSTLKEFGSYTPCLPGSKTINVRSYSVFFSVYNGIRSGPFAFESIETDLHIQFFLVRKAPNGEEDLLRLKLLFLCLEAKKKGATLPEVPYFSGDDNEQMVNEKKKTFFGNLKEDLAGFTYQAIIPQAEIIPEIVLSELRSTDIPFLPVKCDVPDLFEDKKPLWKQANLNRNDFDEPPSFESFKLSSRGSNQSFYTGCIEAEFQAVNQEIEEGKNRLQRYQHRVLIGKNFYQENEGLTKKIENQLTETKQKALQAKEAVLKMVNRHLTIDEEMPLTKEQLRALEQINPPLTIEDLEYIALWGEMSPETLKRVFQTSPILKEKDNLNKMWELLCNYEECEVTCIAYQNALSACLQIDKQSQEDLKESYYFELSMALDTHLETLKEDQDQLTYIQKLIFSRISGLIPRSDQLRDVETLSKRPCILQKMMGEGKTSVIAALWAYKTAKQGKLPIIFTDRSLFTSLGNQLKEEQYTSLKQNIFTIDYSLTQCELPQLLLIKKQLEEGLEKKWVLVMCPETLQSLDLTLQRLTVKNESHTVRIRACLCEILTLFQKESSALGDETDLLLNPNVEVNHPIGSQQGLLATRVDLVRQIFTHLAQNEELGLKEGTHSLRSAEELKEIFRDLAEQLILYKPLGMSEQPERSEAFITYLTQNKDQEIPPLLMDYCTRLKSSLDGKDHERAELIALANHIIKDILPGLFKEFPGLHFGRTKDPSHPGFVVPYTGIDSPSTRVFGDQYEALCKQMFTATVQGISVAQLKDISDYFKIEAKREVLISQTLFQDTTSAKQFQVLTGQSLCEIQSPGVLKEALEKLNSNTTSILQIEAETAMRWVKYHDHYFNSSAQALPHLVGKYCGMSGTPGAPEIYLPETTGELYPDKGAEGQVIYTLCNRAPKIKIHSLEQAGVTALLTPAYHENNPPDAILDMGALLKFQSTEETAKQFLIAAQDHDNAKTSVLFFQNKNPNSSSNDHLAVGRFIDGKWEIELLESSKKKALEAKGIKGNNYIVFFDQRHTTGTDIPLPLKSHALITASETMQQRTLLQTIMRLRKFCSTQTADFVLLKEFHSFLKTEENPLDILDILSFAVANQAQKKADLIFKSYRQQMIEVVVNCLRDRIKQNLAVGCFNDKNLAPYKALLERSTSDTPYAQFFHNLKKIDSIKALQAYQDYILNTFTSDPESLRVVSRDLKIIREKISAIIERAKLKKQALATFIVCRDFDHQNDGQCQQEVQVQIQQEQEITREQKIDLQKEFQSYQIKPFQQKAEHPQWWSSSDPKGSIYKLIELVQHNTDWRLSNGQPLLRSLPNVLKQVTYSQRPLRHFDALFPETLKMTDAMQRSYDRFLPIFHSSQKIAESVLVVRNSEEPFTFVIVSNTEATFLKENMDDIETAWLFNASGRAYSDKERNLKPEEEDKIYNGLTLVNIALGRATSIQNTPKGLLYFHMWLEGGLGTIADRTAYLSLMSYNRPRLDQTEPLITSFSSNTVIGLQNEDLTHPAAEIPTIDNKEKIFLFSRADLDYITPAQVPYIQQERIKYLRAPGLIKAVPKNKLQYLNPKQYKNISLDQAFAMDTSLIEQLPKGLLKQIETNESIIWEKHPYFFTNLSSKQITWLQKITNKKIWDKFSDEFKNKYFYVLHRQVISKFSKEEIQYLHDDQLKHLSTEEQIQAVTPEQVQYLDDEQLRHLNTEEQIQNVPSDKVRYLGNVQLQHLNTPQQIQNIPSDKVRYLRNEQLQHLNTPEQIQAVTPEQVQYLSDEQIQHLNTEQQIQNVPSDKVRYLRNEQLQHLNTPEQIQNVPLDKVRYLGNVQLQHLNTPEQIQAVSPEQVQHLHDEQLQHLNTPEQIQAVSPEQVQHLHDEQLKHLRTQKQIQNVPPDKVRYLRDEQLQHLNSEQIQALEANQVGKLPHQKVVYLQNKQLRYLGSQEQIAQINALQVVLHLTYSQTPYMNTTQNIYYITSRFVAMALICRITVMTYRYIKKHYKIESEKTLSHSAMNDNLTA